MNRKASQCRGFTLVEILIVLIIVGIAVTYSANSFSGAMRSQRIAGAALQLSADLSHASHLAIRDGRTVYVRFYKENDPSDPGLEPQFRAYELFSLSSDPIRLVSLGAKTRLPSGVILTPSATTSNALFQTSSQAQTGSQAGEHEFGFCPDGTTTLPRNGRMALALTLVAEAEITQLGDIHKLPASSRSILINPHTGANTVY